MAVPITSHQALEARLALLGSLTASHVSLFAVDPAGTMARVVAQSPLPPDLPGFDQPFEEIPLKNLPLLAKARHTRKVCRGPFGVLLGNMPIQQIALPSLLGAEQFLLLERSLTHHPASKSYLEKRFWLRRLPGGLLDGLLPLKALAALPVQPFGVVMYDAEGQVSLASARAVTLLRRVLGKDTPVTSLREDAFYETLGLPPAHATGGAVRHTTLRTPPKLTHLTLAHLDDGKSVLLLTSHREPATATPAAEVREKFVQEIHHRVKNNFQMATSLLQMQARQHKEDPRVVAALTTAISRLKSMTVVYEFLSQEGNQSVHLPGLLRELTNQLAVATWEVDAHVRVVCEVPFVPADLATRLAVVVNELVSNAMKHHKDDKPLELEVTLSLVDTDAVLTVSDNGPGPPQGFDFQRAKGLGLRIVRSIVEEDLGGTLALQRKDGHTRIQAVFPRSVLRGRPGAGAPA